MQKLKAVWVAMFPLKVGDMQSLHRVMCFRYAFALPFTERDFSPIEVK
jgi:hypothetical protein